MHLSRMKRLTTLLFLVLFATLFTPELTIDDGAPGISVVQEAFAEGSETTESSEKKSEEKQERKERAREEEEEEEKSEKEKDKSSDKNKESENKHHQPKKEPSENKSEDFNPDDYVSRSDYESLQQQVSDLTKSRQQEVVQRRVDHAINEEYIDGDDEEAVEKVRKIAANDDTWEAYNEITKPRTPDHVAAQRFQSKNLKSNKHTGDQDLLDKVLEHQKA